MEARTSPAAIARLARTAPAFPEEASILTANQSASVTLSIIALSRTVFPTPLRPVSRSGRAGPSPRAARTIKGIEGVDIIITTDEGLRRLSRARGIRIQCGLHVTDYNGVGRFPPAPPVLGVPGCAPPVMNPGGPVSGWRPRGRVAMRADPPGTPGARPTGDSPCADAGLTVTLRHLLG